MRRMIGINDHGLRVGQDHQRAKLSDRDVELIRQMHEAGGTTRKEMAVIFEVSESTIEKIASYKRRNQVATRYVPETKGKRRR